MASESARNEPSKELLRVDGTMMDEWLPMMVTVAARHALAYGTHRNDVADVLEDIARAIRTQDCAESMAPFTLEDLG